MPRQLMMRVTKPKSYYLLTITSHYSQIRKNSKEVKRKRVLRTKNLWRLKIQLMKKKSSLNCIPCCRNPKLKWKFLKNINLQDFKTISSCVEFTHQSCTSFCRWELSTWRVPSKTSSSSHLCRAFLRIFGTPSPNFQEFSSLMVHHFSWKFSGELGFIELIKPLF